LAKEGASVLGRASRRQLGGGPGRDPRGRETMPPWSRPT